MIIGLLCYISLLSIMAFTQLAPFYPLEAKDHGVDPLYIGFVLG